MKRLLTQKLVNLSLLPSLCVLTTLLMLSACSTAIKPSSKAHDKLFVSAYEDAKVLKHTSQADVLNYLEHYQPSVLKFCKSCTTLGSLTPFDKFIRTLNEPRIILVGEIHNRYEHHLNQFAILQALHQQQPKIAIGVEWFQQSFQTVLDQYLKGKLSETEFLKQSEYYERWRYDYRMMRPIIEYAKQHNLPLIALNAQTELTRKIREKGLDGLSPEERAQLPETIPPAHPKYLARLSEVFNQHRPKPKDKGAEETENAQDAKIKRDKALENFLLIQRTWDATMAMNGVKFLKKNPDYTLLVFAGNGHIHEFAIPSDMQQALPQEPLIIVSTQTDKAKNVSSQAQKPEHTNDMLEGLDYLIFSQPVQLPKQGRLGVLLDQREDGLYVKDVMENGAAEKAGVEKGDRFIRIDSQDIATLTDLKLSLLQKAPQASVQLILARPAKKGSIQQIDLTVTLK